MEDIKRGFLRFMWQQTSVSRSNNIKCRMDLTHGQQFTSVFCFYAVQGGHVYTTVLLTLTQLTTLRHGFKARHQVLKSDPSCIVSSLGVTQTQRGHETSCYQSNF